LAPGVKKTRMMTRWSKKF